MRHFSDGRLVASTLCACALILVCTVAVMATGCVPEPRPVHTGGAVPGATPASVQTRPLLEATNACRSAHGLLPYTWDDRLQASAGTQAVDCGYLATLTHVGRDGSAVGQRIADAGLKWSACAENAYVSGWDPSAGQVVSAWESDVGHRANLLGPYARMGAAFSRASDGNTYWVADYASEAH